MILAGDIGGTKTNLGLFDAASGELRRVHFASYRSADFPGLAPVAERFLDEAGVAGGRLAAACFGIAGPVVDNVVRTPNLVWEVHGQALAAALRLPANAVLLLNDLVAIAEGIPLLAADEFEVLQTGELRADGNRVLIAAGTGLGMALLPRNGEGWLAVSSEGGHADFAPRNKAEVGLLLWLDRKFGEHVSVERVLSGPGLVHIYDYLLESRSASREGPVLARRGTDDAKVISEAGLARETPLTTMALAMFVEIYGAAAGNLALTGTAEGGVFLGGGIAPKILPALREPLFCRAFAEKGRLSEYLGRIPIRVILNDRAGLLGAARCGAWLSQNRS